MAGTRALRNFITELNLNLGKPYMTAVRTDFGSAIRGKRTIDSLNDAVNTELARVKTADSGTTYRNEKPSNHARI